MRGALLWLGGLVVFTIVYIIYKWWTNKHRKY